MLRAAIITISLLLSQWTMLCYGGSVTYSDQIEVSGVLHMLDSPICFADATCMNTAALSSGVWGQITGYIDSQLDLSAKFQTKEDKALKGQPNGYASLDSFGNISGFLHQNSMRTDLLTSGYSPEWQVNVVDWAMLDYQLSTSFRVVNSGNSLSVTLADNVGVWSSNWCNLGIFVDNQTTPFCFGSWSGVLNNATFQQVFLNCDTPPLSSGLHVIKIKHRSQYCTYGNYPGDEFGTMRFIKVHEVAP